MAVKIEGHAEPLPGYRLIERLGGGGFGEVWKAEAPGGLYKAIKFVFGDIEGADDDGARAEQELKALKRVKEVRHPYILSLERYDIVDGQLIIVMELADRTLWDRFKECRAEGLPGIPRQELLSYMRESAEALDLMNQQFGLQHLDIKPQNIFLVYSHIKVADFGLIKDLQGTVATVTGGVTPVYAAPETFDGQVSRTTDQYSLAIVYQELLTGHRPFAGTTARQLVLQHLQAEPDLSSLPAADRPIVRKALSKEYTDRFATCNEFVQALMAATSGSSSSPSVSGGSQAPARTPNTVNKVLPPLPHTKPPHTEGHTEPRFNKNDEAAVSTPPDSREGTAPDLDAPVSPPVVKKPPVHAPVSPPVVKKPPVHAPAEPFDSEQSSESNLSAGVGGLPASQSDTPTEFPVGRRVMPQVSSDGIFFPAVVVGVGGFGQSILKQLRRQIQEKFGGLDPLPHIRFLYLDVDGEETQNASKEDDHALRHNEVLHTALHRAGHYLKRRDYAKRIGSWLPERIVYSIPRQQMTSGLRSLGRLAYVDHFSAIRTRLQNELEESMNGETLEKAAQNSLLGIASLVPRVYIVANLAGGTGSGMFVDLAYLVRHLLKKYGLRDADVVGMLLVPEGGDAGSQMAEQANVYGALRELHHFSKEGAKFSAYYSASDPMLKNGILAEQGPPFHRCLVIPAEPAKTKDGKATQKAQAKAVAATTVRTANLLFSELCTPLGRKADEFRTDWEQKEVGNSKYAGLPVVYQCSGIYQIFCPRRQLIRLTARKVCHTLVTRWMSKDAHALRDGIAQWVEQQWGELQLGNDDLIRRLQEFCEKELEQPADIIFKDLYESIITGSENFTPPSANGKVPASGKLNIAKIYQSLEQLQQLLGLPEGCPPVGDVEAEAEMPGKITALLHRAAAKIGNKNEVRVAQLLVRLIEHPEFRLAGAEEAIRQMYALVEKALEHQEPLIKELEENSVSHYQRIIHLLDQADKLPEQQRSGWRFSFSRRTPTPHQQLAVELLELLRLYPKCRYQRMVLKSVESLLVSLRGQLSDQLREVDFCRQRLYEIAGRFDDTDESQKADTAIQKDYSWYRFLGKILLPEGCRSLDAAVKKYYEQISPEQILELDHLLQKTIRRQFRALVQVCLSSTSMLRNFIPVMEATTEAFLERILQHTDVVHLYMNPELTGSKSERSLEDKLLDVYEEAVPMGMGSLDGEELCILASPASDYRDRLRELVQNTLIRTNLEYVETSDAIIIYRERLSSTPAQFKQICKNAKKAYDQVIQNDSFLPHTRLDITNWDKLDI